MRVNIFNITGEKPASGGYRKERIFFEPKVSLGMPFHIGNEIKRIYELAAESSGLDTSIVSKRIGISRVHVYRIMKRKTLDSGLIAKLSELLNYDFFSYLSRELRKSNPSVKFKNEESDAVEKLRVENEALKKEVGLLRKINELHEKQSDGNRK